MSVPPWLVAIFVLVAACFLGTSIIHSFKLFPNETPITSSLLTSEGWQNLVSIAKNAAPVLPSLSGNRKVVAIDEYFQGSVEVPAQLPQVLPPDEPAPSLKAGLDQNIASNTTPLSYSISVGSLETENDTILQQMLPIIQSNIGESSIIPKKNNLDLISGGSNEPADQAMVQESQPNVEKIAPHQQIPEHQPQMVANVETDQGTEAEQIQSNSYATKSVRQNIREEEPLKEESFANPFKIRYTKV